MASCSIPDTEGFVRWSSTDDGLTHIADCSDLAGMTSEYKQLFTCISLIHPGHTIVTAADQVTIIRGKGYTVHNLCRNETTIRVLFHTIIQLYYTAALLPNGSWNRFPNPTTLKTQSFSCPTKFENEPHYYKSILNLWLTLPLLEHHPAPL